MDEENRGHKSVLQDGSSDARSLPLQHLREITNDFCNERLLGEGGFGKVYKGVLQNGDMIAVKKFTSSRPGIHDGQFENEAHHLMRLRHPNIVQLVGYCSEIENILVPHNGRYICAERSERLLCLEYLPNGSLREHLSGESSGLDWDTRYRIIVGVCSGLYYLHEEWQVDTPIIHMDLKPANILLDDNLVPKIADFGLSRLFGKEKTRTCTQSRDGTLGYMAPEYINRGIITKKLDIFSLGVIIIEIMTGHKDYPDESETSSEEFTNRVIANWRNRLESTPWYTSLEIDCQQIRRCLQIGLACVKLDRAQRPTTMQIIEMLHGSGSAGSSKEVLWAPANEDTVEGDVGGGTSTSNNSSHETFTLEKDNIIEHVHHAVSCRIYSDASGDGPKSKQCPKFKMNEEHWDQLIDELKLGCENTLATIDYNMKESLKSKLQQWLSAKLNGHGEAACLRSKHDQCIIHLISALGFEWALSSVLSAGVSINFRDSNGWSALHWAAYFGREKMAATLMAAGASATAVTDPTEQDPSGKTAAFLASERGHKGLAGFLSGIVYAYAIQNAAQPAAHIQNALRDFSFRKRQEKPARLRDEYGMTHEDIDELAAASRSYHRTHSWSGQIYDKAAVSIQKKYKGWKGRKVFLNMRRNAVKIQAHVRGHQVRKKYKTLVSTVSVLEKVILRWRRKGQGLRGFRAEQPAMIVEEEEEDDDNEATRIFRRQKVDEAVNEAVSRVLSMVDSPEARMQYRRTLEEFRHATVHVRGHQVRKKYNTYVDLMEAFSRMLSMVDSPEARMQYRRMLEESRLATAEWVARKKQRHYITVD